MSTKVLKYISVCLLVLVFGALGTGVANAIVTLNATSVTSDVALTLTAAAASTWSTSAGALTITGAGASTWSVTSGDLTVSTGAGALLLTAVGATAGDITLTAGDDFTVNGAATSLYNIGAATTGGTIIIGGTAQTGLMSFGDTDASVVTEISIGGGNGNKTAINIGDGTGANGINIGTGTTGIKTIKIGDDATAVNAITIGGAASNLVLSDAQWSITGTGLITTAGVADGTDTLVLTAGDILVTNGDLDLSGGDFNVVLDAADGVNISKGAAPTADVFTIAGGTPVTANVDGLNISLTTAEGATGSTLLNLNPTFAATTASTFNVLNVAAFTATSTTNAMTARAIAIGVLTEAGTGTVASTAMSVGTGWDNIFDTGGFDVVNVTGATTITGSAEGTAALTLALGDVVLTDGDLTLTSGQIEVPDNAVSFEVLVDATGGAAYLALVTTDGSETMVFGHGTVDSITFTTDGTGTGEIVLPLLSIAGAEMVSDTVTATQLAAALTFAALDYVDLALIVQNSTADQGLRLPQAASATPTSPTNSLEGLIAWNAADNQVIVYSGSAWTTAIGNTTAANTWTDNQIYTFGTDEDIAITNASATTVDVLSLTVTNTDADAAQISLTLGNDTGVDTTAALNLAVTSAITGDVDVLVGLNIADLTTPDNVTVVERALVIGSGWDANLLFADTTTQIQITDTGTYVFENVTGTDFLALSVTLATFAGDLTLTGGDITGTGSESIDISEATANAFTFTRNDAGTVTLTAADDDGTAALTIVAGGTATLSIGDSGDTLAFTGVDMNFAIIDGQSVNIDGDATPTADLVTIGSGDTTATASLDGLNITLITAEGADGSTLLNLNPTFAATTASTFNVMNIAAFTATSTTNAMTARAISIGALTEAGNGTVASTAISISTGWDNIFDTGGFDVVNVTGATTITGSAEGTAALTLALGDVVLTDGDLTLTSGQIEVPDNATSFQVIVDNAAGAAYLALVTTDGAETMVFGHGTVDSVTVTTDGTGDAEVVLPAASVGESELVASSGTGLGVLRTARARYVFGTDSGTSGTGTIAATAAIPDNAVIVGGSINSTTAATSGGSATIAFGVTAGGATDTILAAAAVATLSSDALLNATRTFASPYKMTAAGNINITIAVADLTAGVIEVTVLYYVAAN
ncbi:MAG: hypothetical protein Q7S62_00480 [bacterium]|nr:hypothetical protein [bacterium]